MTDFQNLTYGNFFHSLQNYHIQKSAIYVKKHGRSGHFLIKKSEIFFFHHKTLLFALNPKPAWLLASFGIYIDTTMELTQFSRMAVQPTDPLRRGGSVKDLSPVLLYRDKKHKNYCDREIYLLRKVIPKLHPKG